MKGNDHGSSSSSKMNFIKKLDPEVSIASNGTQHGHPTKETATRLLGIGSKFYQTNVNEDGRAHKPDQKFIADDTYYENTDDEEDEGALGTIKIVVDLLSDKYYVIMPGLPLSEATFDIEK